MNSFKQTIIAELYSMGEKGLTVKALASRLGITKKGMKKLDTALKEMKNQRCFTSETQVSISKLPSLA